MKREQLLDLVIRVVKETAPDLAGSTIDPAKPYAELGLTSLDLVSILSKTTQELNVKVPVAELAGVKTLDEFVDVLAGQPV